MEDAVENNEKTTQLGGITGKGFMPGQSGNPGGRPKNSLKDHMKAKLSEMSPEEKDKWLEEKAIPASLQWKMAEGLPEQKHEHDVDVKMLIHIDE